MYAKGHKKNWLSGLSIHVYITGECKYLVMKQTTTQTFKYIQYHELLQLNDCLEPYEDIHIRQGIKAVQQKWLCECALATYC